MHDPERDIRDIPLSQLELSPGNVRKTPADASAFTELKASIAAHGLLENLIARAMEPGTDYVVRYAVIAGGRRLAVMQALAAEGALDEDHPVPCRMIGSIVAAEEVSLAENSVRAAMHTADQVEAFRRLADAGSTAGAIAARFGVSERTVEKRLRLGNAAPVLLEAYRAGEIDLDTLMAFAVTTDHARQNAVWAAVSQQGYRPGAWQIKRLLTEDRVPATSAIARFVGIEAYEAAGGRIDRDLFAEEDERGIWFDDPELLNKLAMDSLQVAARELETRWKWAEARLDVDWSATASFGRVRPQPAEPTDGEKAEIERLRTRNDELANMDDDGWTEELVEEADANETRLDEIEAAIDARAVYRREDIAIAGCIATVGNDGELKLIQGLVRPEDMPAREPNDANMAGQDDTGDGESASSSIEAPTLAAPPASPGEGQVRRYRAGRLAPVGALRSQPPQAGQARRRCAHGAIRGLLRARRRGQGSSLMAAHARSESARRVSDCMTTLLRDQPFFGSLALRLPIRPDETRETLASDGKDIRYAPQWVADTDADQIKTALARVVLACALKHHTRRGSRDPERWQRASQLVTHGLLRDAGFALPPGAEAWDAISAEQAYDRLPEPPDDAENPGDASSSSDVDDSGSAAGPRCGDGDEDQSAPPNPTDDNSPQEQDAPGSGSNSAGSKPSGQTPASHDPCGTGEVMDADERCDATGQSGESPLDTPAEEQAWDEAMHQAANLARAQGNAPGAVEETIRQAHRSILDWRSLLRRYMTDAARRDDSWSVPNRRFIDSGLYLPSMHSEGIDAIAIIIDTSGSLPGETLALFWAEVREITAELQPDSIYVLQVDAVLQDAARYPAGELPDSITIKGRGGTDFRPGFAWLHEHGVRPSCCLYLTDMECDSYPEAEPGYPVIYCNWGPPPGTRNREPWGERIDIGPA